MMRAIPQPAKFKSNLNCFAGKFTIYFCSPFTDPCNNNGGSLVSVPAVVLIFYSFAVRFAWDLAIEPHTRRDMG